MDHRLARLQQEIATAIAGMTPEQMRRHPSGKWCAAEILEHLYLTYTGTTKGFQRVSEAQHSLASPPTWRHRGRKMVIFGLKYFPSGREAPPVARPRGLPMEKVCAEIGPKISEMDGIISSCEKALGKGDLLDHPILGPLTASQWSKFHLLHGLHHVKQIRGLRKLHDLH